MSTIQTDDVVMAKKRYNEIYSLVKNDEIGKQLLDDVIEASKKYFQHVVNMEHNIKTLKFLLDTAQYQEKVSELDSKRRIYHNNLIDSIFILNRYLFKNKLNVPIGGIYTFDPLHLTICKEDPLNPYAREAIADWAIVMLKAMQTSDSLEAKLV